MFLSTSFYIRFFFLAVLNVLAYNRFLYKRFHKQLDWFVFTRVLKVQLQNLMTSKFVAFFLEEVSSWQQKLSIADQVINSWFEVQRTWMHLESIFMSSDDIRKQLPEDSERFFRIDSEFKVNTRGCHWNFTWFATVEREIIRV